MRSWNPSAFLSSLPERFAGGGDDGPARVGRARTLFFSSFWLWTAGALILLGMALRERAPTLLGLLTLITAGGAWLWARLSLNGVIVTRTLETRRLFPGEDAVFRVSVVNRKLLPLAFLEIHDQLPNDLRIMEQPSVPSGIPGRDVLQITTAMRWYERVSWTFHVHCPVRGQFVFGPTEIRSGDLFGFFTSTLALDNFASLLVYPRVVPLEEIGIPPRHLFGDQRIRRQMVTDPSRIVGVRDYRPEDSIRHVHWKATARVGALQAKVFEPSTTIHFGVFLNLDTFEHYWEGVDYERAEDAITVAASLAIHALDARQTVGVYANGVSGGSDQPMRVRPSRSPSQPVEILAGLAKLSPIASINFARLLRAETSRFPMGSTVVIVTALVTDATAAVLVNLHQAGHRVVLVTIDEVAVPAIRGLLVYQLDSAGIGTPRNQRRRYAIQMNPVALAGLIERQRDAS
ncbi:MAG TPA: DUF58 domain-containing protein [Chloroflexi bacterium]|nr:DUF58 domain-containing protein [Chloroflexota bacterium]